MDINDNKHKIISNYHKVMDKIGVYKESDKLIDNETNATKNFMKQQIDDSVINPLTGVQTKMNNKLKYLEKKQRNKQILQRKTWRLSKSLN